MGFDKIVTMRRRKKRDVSFKSEDTTPGVLESLMVKGDEPKRKTVRKSINEEEEEKHEYKKVQMCQKCHLKRDVPSVSEVTTRGIPESPIVKGNHDNSSCHASPLTQANKVKIVKNKVCTASTLTKRKEQRNMPRCEISVANDCQNRSNLKVFF